MKRTKLESHFVSLQFPTTFPYRLCETRPRGRWSLPSGSLISGRGISRLDLLYRSFTPQSIGPEGISSQWRTASSCFVVGNRVSVHLFPVEMALAPAAVEPRCTSCYSHVLSCTVKEGQRGRTLAGTLTMPLLRPGPTECGLYIEIEGRLNFPFSTSFCSSKQLFLALPALLLLSVV